MNRRVARRWVVWAGVLALILGDWSTPASAQEQEIHGENSSFAGEGVIIVWGILKAPVEDRSRVVIRVAPTGSRYTAISIDGVDPFTGTRREVVGLRPLGGQLELRSPRGTFAELPRREVHFYAAGDAAAGRPSLTVYFMGVPDTTPEFLSETALSTYLEATLAKLRKTAHGQQP